MIGLNVNTAKTLFFDSKKVLSATTKAERRVLSRFGAYVRRTAKSSIRKRKRASKPGSPPSSHTGLLKRFIYFAYEPARRSVVIGPLRLSGKPAGALPALEYGGKTRIVRREKQRGRVQQVKRKVRVAARPFMGPALEKEKPKLPAMWRDSVRP